MSIKKNVLFTSFVPSKDFKNCKPVSLNRLEQKSLFGGWVFRQKNTELLACDEGVTVLTKKFHRFLDFKTWAEIETSANGGPQTKERLF